MSNIEIEITPGPLPPAPPWTADQAGAVVCFEGVVRPREHGRPIAALDYEAYEPMTQREMRRLAEHIVDECGLIALRVEHSVGRIPVGRRSFRLHIAAAHRREALAAMDQFIARMKRQVPLWKVPVWGGTSSADDEPREQHPSTVTVGRDRP